MVKYDSTVKKPSLNVGLISTSLKIISRVSAFCHSQDRNLASQGESVLGVLDQAIPYMCTHENVFEGKFALLKDSALHCATASLAIYW